MARIRFHFCLNADRYFAFARLAGVSGTAGYEYSIQNTGVSIQDGKEGANSGG
jgi:hypothetical protein